LLCAFVDSSSQFIVRFYFEFRIKSLAAVLVGFLKLPIDWETAFATFGDNDLLPPDVVKRLLLEQAELVYVTHDIRSSALTPSRSTTTTPTTDAAAPSPPLCPTPLARSVRTSPITPRTPPCSTGTIRRCVLPSESDLYRVYFCWIVSLIRVVR
jgi:hypothetical protein